MVETPNRRPIASRNTGWARACARRLSASAVTPNQISQGAVVFAALAGLAFWASGCVSGVGGAALLILAALGCQMRLICNLLDGMVAVEGGKSAPDGPFWNEAPDRIADILILVGAGYGAGLPALGWAAAAFAVLTAYVREMGRAEGAANDFCGPMAKPHRMALISGAAVLAAVGGLWFDTSRLLEYALWIIVIGAALTALRRAARILRFLRLRLL